MPASAKVATAYVDLVAHTEAFEKAIGNAKKSIREFNAEAKAQLHEAKDSVNLLGDQIGVKLPRDLQHFVSELPGVATAMSAAFDTIAVVALIGVLVEAGQKIAEFIKKNEEARKKSEEAWRHIHAAAQMATDEIRLSTIQLDNQLARLEHKPENKAAEAVEEIAVATEHLNEQLEQANKQILDLVKAQTFRFFSKEGMQAGTHQEQVMLEEHIKWLAHATTAQDKLNESKSYANALAIRARELEEMQKRESSISYKPEIEAVEQMQLGQAAEQIQLEALVHKGTVIPKIAQLEGAKDLEAELEKDRQKMLAGFEQAFNEQKRQYGMSVAQEMAYWADKLKAFKEGTKEYEAAFQHFTTYSEQLSKQLADLRKTTKIETLPSDVAAVPTMLTEAYEDIAHMGARWTQYNRELAQADKQQTLMNAHLEEMKIQFELATGAISPHAAAVAQAAAHLKQYNAEYNVLVAERARVAEDTSLTPAQRATQMQAITNQLEALKGDRQIQELTDAVAEFGTTWQAMIDSVFDEMIKRSQETSAQLRQISMQFIDSVNTELARGLTGQSMNFEQVFRGTAQSLAKAGIEKTEGMLAQALGLGSFGKMGSKSNPMYTRDADKPGGLAGAMEGHSTGGLMRMVGHGLLGMLNDSDWAGKLFGSGSLFGGGHALGGSVMAGVPIDVGELGRERFVPAVPGRIIPNNQLVGAPMVMNVDARGTDPALTRANFERALQMTHARAVDDAARGMSERARRTPQ